MNLEEATKYMKSKGKEKYKDGTVQLAVLHDEEANDFFKEAENYKLLEIWLEELKELRKHKEKYRWHDLRDNPNDLPDANYPSNTWFEVVQKDNEEELPRGAMQYDDVLGFGFYHDIFDPVSLGYVDTEFTTAEEEGLAEVVAWREIEEFESEEENENS